MKKVFLIDDDADDRDMFRAAINLLDPNIEYIEAKDGQEALDMLEDESFSPDIFFVDLNMPRVNGYEFMIRMRQIARFSSTPAYIYTTCNSPREKINCIAAGATGYIMKQAKYSSLAEELSGFILSSGSKLSA